MTIRNTMRDRTNKAGPSYRGAAQNSTGTHPGAGRRDIMFLVIPAQAGIQEQPASSARSWMPAFAGMTEPRE